MSDQNPQPNPVSASVPVPASETTPAPVIEEEEDPRPHYPRPPAEKYKVLNMKGVLLDTLDIFRNDFHTEQFECLRKRIHLSQTTDEVRLIGDMILTFGRFCDSEYLKPTDNEGEQ